MLDIAQVGTESKDSDIRRSAYAIAAHAWTVAEDPNLYIQIMERALANKSGPELHDELSSYLWSPAGQ